MNSEITQAERAEDARELAQEIAGTKRAIRESSEVSFSENGKSEKITKAKALRMLLEGPEKYSIFFSGYKSPAFMTRL